jgi:hypothetical protein
MLSAGERIPWSRPRKGFLAAVGKTKAKRGDSSTFGFEALGPAALPVREQLTALRARSIDKTIRTRIDFVLVRMEEARLDPNYNAVMRRRGQTVEKYLSPHTYHSASCSC